MRKLVFFAIAAALVIFTSCSKPQGQLVGVYSSSTPESMPYGMVHIPRGSITIGPNDQSVSWASQPRQKTITVESFWMDVTEITNGEYRQFVNWVRDSIVRTKLARLETEVEETDNGSMGQYFTYRIDPFKENESEGDTILNWNTKIPWEIAYDINDDESQDIYKAVNSIYYQGYDKVQEKQLDATKMNYEYAWINYDQAKLPGNSFNSKTGSYNSYATIKVDTAYYDENGHIVNKTLVKKLRRRGDLISRRILNIYPDTMCWMTEYTFSYNDPSMQNYFAHPSYGLFPVVGITWEQAEAFCHWRTKLYEGVGNLPRAQCYRLPTEAEWEYAARGGRQNALYPWGGPYIRDSKGCFLANFKPTRGDYTEDGYLLPAQVGSFDSNDYGLFDMAGNVSEWTIDTYDPTVNTFSHDMNPTYKYEAHEDDLKIMKKKVVKGGSWKDIGAYLQCGMQDFEYQDHCRPSIGFRCVRSVVGE